MGTNNTKPVQIADGIDDSLGADLIANQDPRSPTPEITRTPLQNKVGSKNNVTKSADLRKTFESIKENGEPIHSNPILSAVIKNHLQSYDPRSPTQDFERTPIVIADKLTELVNNKLRHRLEEINQCGSPDFKAESTCDNSENKFEDSKLETIVHKNLCENFFNVNLNDTLTDEPLGSSTASNEVIEENISDVDKPKTLLETDFDYVEYDSHSCKTDVENLDIDVSHLDNAYDMQIPVYKILKEDPRSPTTNIDRTPLIVEKVSTEITHSDFNEDLDSNLINTLQNANAELRQTTAKLTKEAEGLLIYEDKSSVVNETPKKPKSVCDSGSRTPLSCMKNKSEGHERSKSASTLCDQKKQSTNIPTKPKRASHIPKLKALSMRSKINAGSTLSLKNITKSTAVSGDCENTPPCTLQDKWDKDKSILL